MTFFLIFQIQIRFPSFDHTSRRKKIIVFVKKQRKHLWRIHIHFGGMMESPNIHTAERDFILVKCLHKGIFFARSALCEPTNSQQAKIGKHTAGKQVLICFGFLNSRHTPQNNICINQNSFIPPSHSSVVQAAGLVTKKQSHGRGLRRHPGETL